MRNHAGSFDMDKFKDALSEKTKLVAITHMSNVLGTVVPLKEVCKLAHERGIAVLADGSQSAVHIPVDVQDMQPFQGGGEMILDVMEEEVTYADPPHRFEAGTPPIAQAIGLGAALEYMESVGREAIATHENELRDYARSELQKINSLRIIGDAPDKGAIFSFELEGIHAHDVSMVIDRSGVAVRAGTHCAQPLMKHYGVTSTCRASFGMYNTKQEVDVLVEALEKARSFFG